MKRRRFVFWLSLGLFQAGEMLGIDALDRMAAAAVRGRRSFRPSRPTSTSFNATQTVPTVVEDEQVTEVSLPKPAVDPEDVGEPGDADADRRARHGRPPSRWLRSLDADELRVWLETIDPPQATVSGMTFWTHLTRDHFFDPDKIEGLTIDEQAKLHAAAHHGY